MAPVICSIIKMRVYKAPIVYSSKLQTLEINFSYMKHELNYSFAANYQNTNTLTVHGLYKMQPYNLIISVLPAY